MVYVALVLGYGEVLSDVSKKGFVEGNLEYYICVVRALKPRLRCIIVCRRTQSQIELYCLHKQQQRTHYAFSN